MAMMKTLLALTILVGLASAASRLEMFRKALKQRSQQGGQQGQQQGCPEVPGYDPIPVDTYRCRVKEMMHTVLGSEDYLKDTIDAVEKVDEEPTDANFDLVSGKFQEFAEKTLGHYDMTTHEYTFGLYDELLFQLFDLVSRLYIGTTGFTRACPDCAAMEGFKLTVKTDDTDPDGVSKEEYMQRMAIRVRQGLACFLRRIKEAEVLEHFAEKEDITVPEAIHLVTEVMEQMFIIRRDVQEFSKLVGEAYHHIRPEEEKKELHEKELANLLKRLLAENEKP